MNEMNRILLKLSTYPEVDAIAIGGSRATNRYDDSSDYDVYVYLNHDLREEIRTRILAPECSHLEIGNHFWELEDNGTLNCGTDFDIVYRDSNAFTEEVADVVERNRLHNSYTTCFWHNLMTCQIIHERNEMLSNLKKRFKVAYPKKLKLEIIKNHTRLLHGNTPSYDMQIKKAMMRDDYVSINHRVTEFLATYFDLLFALNETYNPGEKRLASIAKATCSKLPKDFETDMEQLFAHMYSKEVGGIIDRMVASMLELVREEMTNEKIDFNC